MTSYELWQLARYGDCISESGKPYLLNQDEQDLADRDSEAEKINDYWEREQENHFNN